jgi:hypothetical protein
MAPEEFELKRLKKRPAEAERQTTRQVVDFFNAGDDKLDISSVDELVTEYAESR